MTPIEPELATQLVRRWVDPQLTVTAVRPLRGGMVHQVCRWETDRDPPALVAKLNAPEHLDAFERERRQLQWYRTHSRLPVPEPIAAFHAAEHGLAGLVMEHVPGVNLAHARLSGGGIARVQRALAEHVAELHTHHRDAFGPALEDAGHARWCDAFAPGMRREFEQVRDQLTTRTRQRIDRLLANLDHWLPEAATPTLVHGDLWSTNILVDDRHPDRPRLLAFIDCDAAYCDPEYELAYLRLFRTADETFFDAYTRHHPLRPGFERRCRVYWLNTMLLHVRHFGDRYLPACEQLADQLDPRR